MLELWGRFLLEGIFNQNKTYSQLQLKLSPSDYLDLFKGLDKSMSLFKKLDQQKKVLIILKKSSFFSQYISHFLTKFSDKSCDFYDFFQYANSSEELYSILLTCKNHASDVLKYFKEHNNDPAALRYWGRFYEDNQQISSACKIYLNEMNQPIRKIADIVRDVSATCKTRELSLEAISYLWRIYPKLNDHYKCLVVQLMSFNPYLVQDILDFPSLEIILACLDKQAIVNILNSLITNFFVSIILSLRAVGLLKNSSYTSSLRRSK